MLSPKLQFMKEQGGVDDDDVELSGRYLRIESVADGFANSPVSLLHEEKKY